MDKRRRNCSSEIVSHKCVKKHCSVTNRNTGKRLTITAAVAMATTFTFIATHPTTLPMVAAASGPATPTKVSVTTVKQINDDANRKRFDDSEILQDIYATISRNMGENSRKLNLEDFSWGIFSGSKGRLQGFGHFQLVNNKTMAETTSQPRKLSLSFEFTVPTLSAVWEKSVCLGYCCVMTMELDKVVFALRVAFDADDCVFEHLAFLKSYRDARCIVGYLETSSIPSSFVQTTVKLFSGVMNTKPFQKIIKDNVDYALLQLPLFTAVDIERICNYYRQKIQHDD